VTLVKTVILKTTEEIYGSSKNVLNKDYV